MAVIPVDVFLDVRAGDRGLYRLKGVFSALAPLSQIIRTPNGTPISLTSFQADSWPRVWSIFSVIEPAPADAPSWAETEKRIIDAGGDPKDLTTLKEDETKSALQVFGEGSIKTAEEYLNKGLEIAGNVNDWLKWAVLAVVIVLVLLIILKRG